MNDKEKALKHLGKAIEHIRQTDADDQFLENLETLVNSAPDQFRAQFIPKDTTFYVSLGIDRYSEVVVAKLFRESDDAHSHRSDIRHDYENAQVVSSQIQTPDGDD